jgi:hypothetical protein
VGGWGYQAPDEHNGMWHMLGSCVRVLGSGGALRSLLMVDALGVKLAGGQPGRMHWRPVL